MNPSRKLFREAGRHFNREARFANPARSRNRYEPNILPPQEFLGPRFLLFSSHKPGPRRRKIAGPSLHTLSGILGKAVSYRGELPCEISRRGITLTGFFG